MDNTDLHPKLLAFLAGEFARKESRQCIRVELLYAQPGFREEPVRSWWRDEDPEVFEGFAKTEQLVSALIEAAEDHTDDIGTGSQRFVVRTRQYFGGRAACSFKLSPSANLGTGIDLTAPELSPSANLGTDSALSAPAIRAPKEIRELKETLTKSVENAGELIAVLDELAQLRSKDRLHAEAQPTAATDDLPPDAATGLYLDRPFDVEDFEWIKMAWDAYRSRNDGGPPRPSQIMLVFQAIRRDERATCEFLRVMNTIVLPLLRRLRLKEHPHLTTLGAASE